MSKNKTRPKRASLRAKRAKHIAFVFVSLVVFTLLSSEKAKRTKPSASQVACEMVSNLP